MSKFIFYVFGILLSFSVVAQKSDSIMVLKDVIIHESLLKSAEIGLTEIKIDSLTLAQGIGTNIANLLRNTAAGQIRSYGANGLSLPSFRGTGSEQTAILWNGINLQSPLNGGQDLSLLPNSFANEVILQKGGTSSLYGSGAIGGSIQLNNSTYFNKGLQLTSNQSFGSFANHYQSYAFQYSNNSFSTSTLIFKRTIENDHDYLNTYINPPIKEKRSNASVDQMGVLQQNDWKIGTKNIVGIKLWYQNNNIEIPNSIIASDNNQPNQNDEFTRVLFSWSHDRDRFSLVYKQAYIWHKLYYQPSVGVSSKNISSTWLNRIEMNFDLNERNELILGANHTYDQSNVDQYGSHQPTRNSTAIFASLRSKSKNKKLLAALSIREEWIDFKGMNFAPSLGVDYLLLDHSFLGQLRSKGNLSRNYRIPTLNNLHWKSANEQGNINLKPEVSNNLELGLKHKFSHSNLKLTSEITGYYYLVDNWMQWQETDSLGWTPINLKKVLSKGLETSINADYSMNDKFISIGIVYNKTNTINKKINNDTNPNELKKQLIYTPIHEGSFNAKFGFNKSIVTVNHTYTGMQFSDADNKQRFALSSYQITNLSLNQSLIQNKFNLNLQLDVNNLLDVAYENKRGYPMYERNYSIGITVNFNHKPKNND